MKNRWHLGLCTRLFTITAVCAALVITSQGTTTGDAAESLLSAGRVDDAVRVLKRAAQGPSPSAEIHHLLCRAFFALEKPDLAIPECESAVAAAPQVSAYHLWLGRAYGMKADHSNFVTASRLARKVRAEFERAVDLDSSNTEARSDLAEFYLEAPGFLGGGKDKARAQALEIARRDAARAHWIQGLLAERDKKLAAAESEYKTAVQVSGNRGEHWLDLASFYRRVGRLNEMEDTINRAIQADKKKSNVLFDAAFLLVRAGRNFPEAAKLILRYLSSNDKVETAPAFQAHYLLGSILENQGDKKGASEQYHKALALAKDYDKAQQALNRLR